MNTCIVTLLALPALSLEATASDEFSDVLRPTISVDEIALELSNPVTGLRSFAFDIQYRTYQGDFPGSDDQTAMRTVFAPSWPFKLSNGKNLLLRATIPMNSDQPTWTVNDDCQCFAEFLIRQSPIIDPTSGQFESGHDYLDDIGFDIGYGGVNENGLISMIGLASIMPTSTDDSADRGLFLLGPDLAFGQVRNWGLIGVRAKHLSSLGAETTWDFDDTSTSWGINETTVQLFFSYALGKGWQIESNPIILYDWEAVSGNEWSVPIGAGVSKTIRIGGAPMKLALEAQHFVVSPDRFGPEWQFIFSFTSVISTQLLR